jgi:hypothetical protein
MDINRENYESWFLDYVEGSLTAGQISQVHQFVAENPDLQKELQAWKQTVLQPDLTLVYPDKEQLKRRSRILPIGWMQGLGAVAAVGLLLWLALPLVRQVNPEQPAESVAHGAQRPDSLLPQQAAPSTHAPETAVPQQHPLSVEGRPSSGQDSPGSAPAKAAPAQATPAQTPSAQSPSAQSPSAQSPSAQSAPGPTHGVVPVPGPRKQPRVPDALPPVQHPETAVALLQTPGQPSVPAKAPIPVQTRAPKPVAQPEPVEDLLADAMPRLVLDAGLAEAGEQPTFPVTILNEKLPFEVGSLLTTTQSFAQNAGRSIAGFMSGESEWLSVLPFPNDRNAESRKQPTSEGTAEPEEEAREVRFSVGGFKVYHRKTTKSDS